MPMLPDRVRFLFPFVLCNLYSWRPEERMAREIFFFLSHMKTEVQDCLVLIFLDVLGLTK